MRIGKVFSRVAWGEREGTFRSAKGSAAMVVATFAALLFCCTSSLKANLVYNGSLGS
jgi:hypothetical protein